MGEGSASRKPQVQHELLPPLLKHLEAQLPIMSLFFPFFFSYFFFLINFFASVDLFFFYIFFEGILLPMFILIIF